jgi:deazaflavin-dependent oxidoreductase (nitroreductase family)
MRERLKSGRTRLGRRMARFNRDVGNHLTRPLASRVSGFGVVIHTGRRSGRRYRTPVNVFAVPGGYVVALTYGAGDWVRNVEAAGGCDLVIRGELHHVIRPRLVRDEARRAVPVLVRPILRLLRVTQFLYLDDEGGRSG